MWFGEDLPTPFPTETALFQSEEILLSMNVKAYSYGTKSLKWYAASNVMHAFFVQTHGTHAVYESWNRLPHTRTVWVLVHCIEICFPSCLVEIYRIPWFSDSPLAASAADIRPSVWISWLRASVTRPWGKWRDYPAEPTSNTWCDDKITGQWFGSTNSGSFVESDRVLEKIIPGLVTMLMVSPPRPWVVGPLPNGHEHGL